MLRRPLKIGFTYLISTFAPAASIFFFISSASCFVTPSLIVFGAPSTSAFASARPSPGTAPRASLITAILFASIAFSITSNVVFSSAAGAAVPPDAPAAAGPAATATGAAALTPHFSSSCLTNPAISSTDRLLSCSTNFSVSAILFFPPIAASESLRRIKADSHRLGQFSFSSSTRQKTGRNLLCARLRWFSFLLSLCIEQPRQCGGWFIQYTHQFCGRRQKQFQQLRLQNFARRQFRERFQ